MKIFTKGFIVAVLVSSHVAGFAAVGAIGDSFPANNSGFGAEPAKVEDVIHIKSSEQLSHTDFVRGPAYAAAAKNRIISVKLVKPSSLLKGAAGYQLREKQMPTLSAYPNPTRGVTTLSLTQVGSDNYKIRISNTIGKVVQTIELKDLDNATEIPLNLSHLPSGIYFYSLLINEKMVETKRLVLQR